MERAYLGLFQKVFEWVLAKIVEPVYGFVSGLLMDVFSWIFKEILAPLLMPVLEEALDFFIKRWLEIYSNHLYLLFSGLLKLIDYLETAFDVFIGLRDVTYTEPGGAVVTGTLVEVLTQQKTVSTVFWVITLGALGIAMILTIYATAKSAFDLDFENKKPVSKVLTAMMKTFIQFFTVPFFVYFMLKLSAVILRGVTNVMNFGNTTSLGRIVFMIASLNAAKNDQFNVGSATALNIQFGTSRADTVRYPFYTLIGGNGVTVKDYGNIKQVTEEFNLASFDYIIGFIAAVFLLFTIGVCLIIFVQRIFELMLLYLVSPYFVSMIPIDDGERFGRWRDLFIGKCFTGFGSVIGMRLFLMVCPMIMGNRIKFGTAASPEMDYMMKLFFLAGGAWAVYKSGSMITSLLSSQAGMSESNTASVAGGMLFSHTVGMAMAKGRQAVNTGLARAGSGSKAGMGRADSEAGRFKGNSGKDLATRGGKKPGLGTRVKNTMAAGKITAGSFRGMKRSLADRDFKGAAKQGLKAMDGMSNIGRLARGKEAKAGVGERLRNRYNNTIEAARKGSDAVAAGIERTQEGIMKSAGSLENAYKTLKGKGTFSQKAGSIGNLARDLYGVRKEGKKTWEAMGRARQELGQAIHRVDINGSTMSADFSGEVLAREFPKLGFQRTPEKEPGTAAGPSAPEGGQRTAGQPAAQGSGGSADSGRVRMGIGSGRGIRVNNLGNRAIGSHLRAARRSDGKENSGRFTGAVSVKWTGSGRTESLGSTGGAPGTGRTESLGGAGGVSGSMGPESLGSVGGAPGTGMAESLESAPGILGMDSMESPGSTAGVSGTGRSESLGSAGPRTAGTGTPWVSGVIRREEQKPWTPGVVPRNQIRCVAVPSVRKVTSSKGEKVAYKSLSIQGLKYSNQNGNRPITRRNSI